jgi:hypothetical protein
MTAALPGMDELTANQFAVADAAVIAAGSAAGGWDAGQVCAHLIMNNGAFMQIARAVERGGKPTYDNEATVDDEAVAALAAAAGSIERLAEWLRDSASAYAGFLSGLSSRVMDAPILATIHHDGQLILDGEERRLGDLMTGQLTFHSTVHLEQVRQLTPS